MSLFRNRQFIALFAALVFFVAQAIFPELPFSEEQTLVFFGLIAAYVIGEGLEGKRILENFAQLARSRKFLATVAGLVVVVAQAFYPEFPISPDNLLDLFAVLAAIVLGSGAESLKAIS